MEESLISEVFDAVKESRSLKVKKVFRNKSQRLKFWDENFAFKKIDFRMNQKIIVKGQDRLDCVSLRQWQSVQLCLNRSPKPSAPTYLETINLH